MSVQTSMSETASSTARQVQWRAAFALVDLLLHRLPEGFLLVSEATLEPISMVELADKVYSATDNKLAAAAAESLQRHALTNALTALLSMRPHNGALGLITFLAHKTIAQLAIDWRPAGWLETQLQASAKAPFERMALLVPAIMELRTSGVTPGLCVDSRATMTALIEQVRQYAAVGTGPH